MLDNLLAFFKKIFGFFLNFLVIFRGWIREVIPFLVVGMLVFILGFSYFFPEIVITVNSGEAGVLYKRFFGTVTDETYPEGIHVIFPWDTLYVYNVRIQTILHEFDIITNKGLPIRLSLAIRFQPDYEMLGMLHQQVGPDYINAIIIPEVESVLRTLLSIYDPEDIYANKEDILTRVIVEATEELEKKYITAKGIVIRSIILPDSIRAAIENKLVQQQLEKAYIHILEKEKKEAERKRIEAQGITDYQNIVIQTLSPDLIKWQGVQATLELAKSNNAKIVIIGSGKEGLPIILGNDYNVAPSSAPLNSLIDSNVPRDTKKSINNVK